MSRSVYMLVLFLLFLFGHQRVCLAITEDDFYPFGDNSIFDGTPYTDTTPYNVIALANPISLENSGCQTSNVVGANITIGGKVFITEDTTESDPQIILNVLNIGVMDIDQHTLHRRSRSGDMELDTEKLFAPFMESFSRNHSQFVPTSYSVFTWKLEESFPASANMINLVNLFQVVIATNGTQVLIAYMYAEGMLQFGTSSANHDVGMGIEVCGAKWTHPSSTKSTILNDLVTDSNVNVPGVWMFMINNGELILPVACSAGCSFVTGTCSEPNMCSCFRGWEGDDCTTPSCPDGCVNGNCNAPFNCTCNPGWLNVSCSVAACSSACTNGKCNVPNVCECDNGWENENCTSPICSMSCNNGTCIGPDDCHCEDGYQGQWCDVPICLGGTDCAGYCNVPGECLCNEGFKGTLCNEEITTEPPTETTTTTTEPPNEADSGGLSGGAIGGIVAGILVFVFLAVGMVFFVGIVLFCFHY